MHANAELLVDHFRWDAGTRVEALSFWNSEQHVRVRCPAREGRVGAQIWTLPASAVKLDPDVVLEIETSEIPLQAD